MSTQLTAKQIELLTDIATHPAMYIRVGTRWDLTAKSLIRKGLAEIKGVTFSPYSLEITNVGRAEATRRGLTPEAKP